MPGTAGEGIDRRRAGEIKGGEGKGDRRRVEERRQNERRVDRMRGKEWSGVVLVLIYL